MATVAQWPTPTTAKEIRSFLGLAGYYRKFVQHFGIIAWPLFNLLKKHQPFVWTEATNEVFELLKQRLISGPVLQLPDFSRPFTVDTDACEYGVGAVLQQNGHLIAFMSKPLGPKNRGLSTYEKECLAILMAMEQWHPYLQNAEFLICTDQCSLVHLDDQRLSTPWQQKAFTKLLGLCYKIVYRQGTTNNVADALSRRTPAVHLQAMSVCQPAWLDDIVASYSSNPQVQKIMSKLKLGADKKGRFHVDNGCLYFQK